MDDIEYLRNLYLEDLRAPTTYGNVTRTRVRYPNNWARLSNVVRLNEDVSGPVDLFADPNRKVWVWSDVHFFHKNIIEFSNRPYMSVSEMNEHLVANFNEYVGPNDISLWVGDVGFKGNGFINELLAKCNGYKILVVGNHDFDNGRVRKLFFDETHLLYKINTPDADIVFTHYPMNNIELPWFNVHGHLHAYPNPYTGNPLHYNVCCELHNYRPVELNNIIDIAKTRLRSMEE